MNFYRGIAEVLHGVFEVRLCDIAGADEIKPGMHKFARALSRLRFEINPNYQRRELCPGILMPKA